MDGDRHQTVDDLLAFDEADEQAAVILSVGGATAAYRAALAAAE